MFSLRGIVQSSWKRTVRGARPRPFRLGVEHLEQREVPAVLIQSFLPPTGAVEGAPTGGNLAVFSGSSTNIADYTATVNWGDGTTSTLDAGNGGITPNVDGTFTVTATNTYAEEGNDNFTLTVSDPTSSATTSAVVAVADAPITANYSNIVNGTPGAPLGASPVTVATFTDGNPGAPASDFTATIDWGDGTAPTAGTVSAVPGAPDQWQVLGNHTYAKTGAYRATVTLTDIGSATATADVPVTIANPSPLQVTPYDPTTPLSTLTNALVKPGTGLNVVGSSFVGQNGQAGTYTGFNFHDQNSSLSLTDGILLTSGSATNALGPNNQTGATTAYSDGTNTMGDPQLDALVAPDVTYDANTLTLQFTTAPGVTSIQFQFVFGSEEFPEWVGQFNDVFAAFLDGKQISFDPAGNPISVNNNYFQLNNSNDNTYPAYSAGKTEVAYDIQYDGLTPALTTKATLDPTVTTHTLTFAIADTRDMVLDSGAFITGLAGISTGSGGSGGSGDGTTPAPQANAGGPYTVTAGQSVQLDASKTTDAAQDPATLTYKWDLNGNGIFGETGAAATNGNEVGIKPTFVATGLAAGSTATVALQVTDSNGVVSTDQAVINVVAPQYTQGSATIGDGPGGANTLLIVGTSGDDVIRVTAHGDKGAVKVTINGVSEGVFAKGSFSAIAAYGLAGNDRISVDGDVKAPAYLYGGDGNDVITGGGGANYLSGGAGHDNLFTGDGFSILVGGTGADNLHGGDRPALLIGGSTDFANQGTPGADPQAAAVLTAWTKAGTKTSDRIDAAKALLTGHIVADAAKDVIHAGDGTPLIFLGMEDQLLDRKKGDVVIVN